PAMPCLTRCPRFLPPFLPLVFLKLGQRRRNLGSRVISRNLDNASYVQPTDRSEEFPLRVVVGPISPNIRRCLALVPARMAVALVGGRLSGLCIEVHTAPAAHAVDHPEQQRVRVLPLTVVNAPG